MTANSTSKSASSLRSGKMDSSQLDNWSDWLNPMLVKEMRQVARSHVFQWTFLSVVVGSWFLGLGAIIVCYPAIRYQSFGRPIVAMLGWLMIIPLIILVPGTMFRSMELERREATFELLSLTTLSSLQIVRGKLLSILAMALILWSVAAPSLVFAYLLGGIDIVEVISVPLGLFFVCVVASSVAALAGSLARHTVIVTVIALALVLCLFFLAYLCGGLIWEAIWEGSTPVGWWKKYGDLVVAWAVLIAACTSLCVALAAARWMPPEVDRSSFVRMRLVWAAGAAMMVVATVSYDFPTTLGAPIDAVFYFTWVWFVGGILLVAERTELSKRIRRRLPASPWRRILVAWRIPGSAGGYVFAVASMAALSATPLLVTWLLDKPGPGLLHGPAILLGPLLINWIYFAAYLGIIRLVLLLVRRFFFPKAGFVTGLVIGLVVFVTGTFIPSLLLLVAAPFQLEDSQLLLTPSWTLRWVEIYQDIFSGLIVWTTFTGFHDFTLPAAIVLAVVWVLNLPSLVRGLFAETSPLPQAVAEAEEAERAPPPTPDPFAD